MYLNVILKIGFQGVGNNNISEFSNSKFNNVMRKDRVKHFNWKHKKSRKLSSTELLKIVAQRFNIKIFGNYTDHLRAYYFFLDEFYLGPFKANGILCFSKVKRNNIFSIVDLLGNTLAVVSSGSQTSRRRLRATPSVIEATVKVLLKKMRSFGVRYVILKYKSGNKRQLWIARTVIRWLTAVGVGFIAVIHSFRQPHNGCRFKSTRRV